MPSPSVSATGFAPSVMRCSWPSSPSGRCPLEISQTSNVCLGNAESHARHPLSALRDSGVAFSINSDDPALFDTCLNREYRLAAELLDLEPRDIGDLALAALSHSFLAEAEKRGLEREFRQQIDAALGDIAG